MPAAKRKHSHTGGLYEPASAAAPFVYFDRAPNFGVNGAVAIISLEEVRFAGPAEDQAVVADRQLCWMADKIHLPPRLRRKVQISVASVRSVSLPATTLPSASVRVTSIMLKRMATVA